MTEPGTGNGEGGELTRRRLLQGSLAAGVAGATLSTGAGALIDKASAATAGPNATLGDIEHVVFLMQENRSFDHYFGTLFGGPGVLRPVGGPPGRGRHQLPGVRSVRLPPGEGSRPGQLPAAVPPAV